MPEFRQWTPRYVVDKSRVKVLARLRPERPWLTDDAIELLEQLLRPEDRGLEVGSGRSTPWFGDRLGHLLSVEHNLAWGERVKAMLREAGLDEKVDHRVLSTDGGPDSPYVAAICDLPDHSVDFALIDGELRDHALAAAIDKVRPGGVLAVDNINWFWPHDPPLRAPNSRGPADGFASAVWETNAARMSEWRRVWTTNGVSDTALFFPR